MTGLQVDYWKLEETQRANKASETQRANELKEATRHNKVTEGETERHNRASESIQWAQVGETQRHNVAMEGIQSEYNTMWYQIQQQNVGIQQQQADIARQRAQVEADRLRMQYQQFDWQRQMDVRQQGLRELQESHSYETAVRSNEIAAMRAENDFTARTRELDIAEKELKLKKSKNVREWLDSSVNWFTSAVNNWSTTESQLFDTGGLGIASLFSH